jgi:DNA-binding response OmpR family regulator
MSRTTGERGPAINNNDKSKRAAQLKVLVAESEPDIQSLYRIFLREWAGPIVDTGRQCIDIALKQESDFDAIIIDSHVRGSPDGLEAAKRILEARPGQHVVITTTTAWETRQRAADMGIPEGQIDLMEKPFGFSDLLAKLASRAPRTSAVGLTDHVLAIYESEDDKFAEAAEFLKRSISRNEVALFIVGKGYGDIEAVKSRLYAKGIDAGALMDEGSLIVMRNEDWYIPQRGWWISTG